MEYIQYGDLIKKIPYRLHSSPSAEVHQYHCLCLVVWTLQLMQMRICVMLMRYNISRGFLFFWRSISNFFSQHFMFVIANKSIDQSIFMHVVWWIIQQCIKISSTHKYAVQKFLSAKPPYQLNLRPERSLLNLILSKLVYRVVLQMEPVVL